MDGENGKCVQGPVSSVVLLKCKKGDPVGVTGSKVFMTIGTVAHSILKP